MRRAEQRGAALGELAVQRHARQVRADDGDLAPSAAGARPGSGCGAGSGCAGRALRQPGGVVVALAELGQLQVAAAAADQRDAEGQAVGAQAAGHRDRGVVEQVDEVGVGAQVAVERHRVGLHRLDRVVRGRGRHQQHVDVAPTSPRRAAPSARSRVCASTKSAAL